MSDKHLVNAIKYLEQHNPNHNMLEIMYKERDYRKKRLPKEKYSEFCKRVYTRYL